MVWQRWIGAMVLLGLGACSGKSRGLTGLENIGPEDCDPTFTRIADRDLARWRGWPRQCTASELVGRFSNTKGEPGVTPLGTKGSRTPHQSVQVTGYPDGLRYWFKGEAVLALDAETPELGAPYRRVMSALGPPSHKLNTWIGDEQRFETEWVYLDRGLTLYVDEELEQVLHVVYYAPTTLDAYRSTLRLDLRHMQ